MISVNNNLKGRITAKQALSGELNNKEVRVYPELENLEITSSIEEQKFKSKKYGYNEVLVKAIEVDKITIIPTNEPQKETGLFRSVTVEAVKGETLNIVPTEEAQTKTGLFDEVNVSAIQTEEVSSILDFSVADKAEITSTADNKYIKKATINKDKNLIPENIKSGVSIFGVEGALLNTDDADATAEDILLGKSAYVAGAKIVGTGDYLNEIIALKREIEPFLDFVESETGNPVIITDSSDLECEVYLLGNTVQNGDPTPDKPVEIETVGSNGSVSIKVDNNLEEDDENYQSYIKALPVQKEFCKIGDYQDCFIKQDEKWHEQHCTKIVLNGSESFLMNANDNGKLRVTLKLNDLKTNTNQSETIDAISNYFIGTTALIGTTKFLKNSVSVISNQRLYFVLDNNTFDSVETFKTWVGEQYSKGTPVIVYYVAEQAELLECTEEQAEILNSFTTYRNKTRISTEDIAELKVLYKKER